MPRKNVPVAATTEDATPVGRLLRVREVAQILSISERSVWRLIESRDILVHKIGTATRVANADLETYLQRCRA